MDGGLLLAVAAGFLACRSLRISPWRLADALAAPIALLDEPYSTWDANHFATSLLAGLEGDVRVIDDSIIVTYYNAPNADRLRQHYEGLPERLQREHIDPHVPWLYGFKLDFRFL